MRIERHFQSEGFWALKPEWNDLLRRSYYDNLFLTWEWQSTWWKHLGEGDLMAMLTEEDQKKLDEMPDPVVGPFFPEAIRQLRRALASRGHDLPPGQRGLPPRTAAEVRPRHRAHRRR